MAPCLESARRQSIPVIVVKGTYFEVGYDIGRTFGSLIHSHINICEINDVLPIYNTPNGKKTYDELLDNVTKYYPQYIQELKGMAEGANIPFYKLFLLHLGDILTSTNKDLDCKLDTGCSTLCINERGQELIGHTEDGLKTALNHVYIVKAHITESEPHEVYTALCYAGLLPGYSMGFNNHGLIFTINVIPIKNMNRHGIPRTFVARALLGADTFQKAENILKCKPNGIADGMSVNMTFLNQKGDRLFHNIEVSPNYPTFDGTSISILTISPGEQIFHCNKLLHLVAEEDHTFLQSNVIRHQTKDSYGKLVNKKDLIRLLGDNSHPEYNIFRDGNRNVLTVAVAIFDVLNKTWSVYIDNPRTSEPLITMPLEYKDLDVI